MNQHSPFTATQTSDVLRPISSGEQTEAWLRLAVAMLVPVLLLLVGMSLTR